MLSHEADVKAYTVDTAINGVAVEPSEADEMDTLSFFLSLAVCLSLSPSLSLPLSLFLSLSLSLSLSSLLFSLLPSLYFLCVSTVTHQNKSVLSFLVNFMSQVSRRKLLYKIQFDELSDEVGIVYTLIQRIMKYW